MGRHEVECFAAHLQIDPAALDTWNLLERPTRTDRLNQADAALIGGSGDYSVVRGGPWLDGALDTMRLLAEARTPTFASCWGFQAMSLALGGSVEHLPERGHVGTCAMTTTPSPTNDPVFGALGDTFTAQFGHEDVVVTAPATATVLVTSEHGDCMAWRLGDANIWGTQFHPELSDQDLLLRLRRYPKYVREISGLSMEDFEATRMAPAPDADHLLHAFASQLAWPVSLRSAQSGDPRRRPQMPGPLRLRPCRQHQRCQAPLLQWRPNTLPHSRNHATVHLPRCTC